MCAPATFLMEDRENWGDGILGALRPIFMIGQRARPSYAYEAKFWAESVLGGGPRVRSKRRGRKLQQKPKPSPPPRRQHRKRQRFYRRRTLRTYGKAKMSSTRTVRKVSCKGYYYVTKINRDVGIRVRCFLVRNSKSKLKPRFWTEPHSFALGFPSVILSLGVTRMGKLIPRNYLTNAVI